MTKVTYRVCYKSPIAPTTNNAYFDSYRGFTDFLEYLSRAYYHLSVKAYDISSSHSSRPILEKEW